MSTRSEIAIQKADGTIESIYCHSDGYLSYMGILLHGYYNSYEKAKSIIKENDCSILETSIEESRFYNTWRNEDTQAKKFSNEFNFMHHFSDDIFIEYIYLFKNGEWFFSKLKFIDNPKDSYSHCLGYHTEFISLSDVLSQVENPYPFEEVAL
jgi:hypothetical protein